MTVPWWKYHQQCCVATYSHYYFDCRSSRNEKKVPEHRRDCADTEAGCKTDVLRIATYTHDVRSIMSMPCSGACSRRHNDRQTGDVRRRLHLTNIVPSLSHSNVRPFTTWRRRQHSSFDSSCSCAPIAAVSATTCRTPPRLYSAIGLHEESTAVIEFDVSNSFENETK